MLESLITIQAILCNVNGAVIPRSISSSAGAITVLSNRVTAANGYDASIQFRQPWSLSQPSSRLQVGARQPHYFASPGWAPRYSSTLSSSSSILFAARGGGGDLHGSNLSISTNSNQDEGGVIEIPFREYGYRSTPFSWEELDKIIVQEQNLAKLSRSVPQEQEYQLALRALRKEWKSTKDYILHSKFGLPKELDQATKMYFVKDDTGNKAQSLRTIVPNDFPYYCAPGIEHWVLWKYGGDSSISKEDVAWAKQEIAGQGSNMGDDNVIWWENPPNLKSLPEISHVHMLVRRQEE